MVFIAFCAAWVGAYGEAAPAILVAERMEVPSWFKPVLEEALAKANAILADPEFEAGILARAAWVHPPDHVRRFDDNAEILRRLRSPSPTVFRTRTVAGLFYVRTNAWTDRRPPVPVVSFNRVKLGWLSRRMPALVATLIHEHAHVAGYGHIGDRRDTPPENKDTVPYGIEPLVERVYAARFGGRPTRRRAPGAR